MRTVLSSIPVKTDIHFMKTDMQGTDFSALSSAGTLLQRVHYLRVECWIKNIYTYVGVNNDFCRHLFPYMTSIGFELLHMHGNSKARKEVNNYAGVRGHAAAVEYCEREKAEKQRVGTFEADAYFRRAGTRLEPPEGRDWPSDIN
mmetsp:Transcript_37251/g.92726  ORF Transcript_37251/g.92726 Transcript_37251/m.92726 type:complete len:145 (+) Transcript_37251:187-621(+)